VALVTRGVICSVEATKTPNRGRSEPRGGGEGTRLERAKSAGRALDDRVDTFRFARDTGAIRGTSTRLAANLDCFRTTDGVEPIPNDL
jgi:hypothetical protein